MQEMIKRVNKIDELLFYIEMIERPTKWDKEDKAKLKKEREALIKELKQAGVDISQF